MQTVLIGLVVAIVFLIVKANNLKAKLENDLDNIRNSNLSNEMLLHTIDTKLTMVMSERNVPIAVSESAAITHVFKDPSPRIKKWMLMKIGINKQMVKKILGDGYYRGNNQYKLWSYDDGTIHYNDESGLVTGYDFSFKHFESDLTRWEQIKKNMSKEEVVAIIGNPLSVGVETENHDNISENWFFQDKEKNVATIYFNHMNKIDQLKLSSKTEMEEASKRLEEQLSKWSATNPPQANL